MLTILLSQQKARLDRALVVEGERCYEELKEYAHTKNSISQKIVYSATIKEIDYGVVRRL
jgi:hypothetical protein